MSRRELPLMSHFRALHYHSAHHGRDRRVTQCSTVRGTTLFYLKRHVQRRFFRLRWFVSGRRAARLIVTAPPAAPSIELYKLVRSLGFNSLLISLSLSSTPAVFCMETLSRNRLQKPKADNWSMWKFFFPKNLKRDSQERGKKRLNNPKTKCCLQEHMETPDLRTQTILNNNRTQTKGMKVYF